MTHPLTGRLQEPEDVYRAAAEAERAASSDASRLAERSGPRAIAYGLLKKTNPHHDEPYWQEIRALYEGGRALLRDDSLLERVFPKHQGETDVSYQERKRRAYYVGHLCTVVDIIVAGLAADPVRAVREEGGELPVEWEDFMRDCSPPGGARVSFANFISDQVRTGLLLGRFCTLVDLPRAEREFVNLAEQEAAGALRPYLCAVDPECVLDWEEDKSGELKWCVVRSCSMPRSEIWRARDLVVEEYVVYTRRDWTLYRVEYTAGKEAGEEGGPPRDDELVEAAEDGTHTLGRVPVIYEHLHRVAPGLWAGNKLHSLSVEHLNKNCGLSWAEYKTCYSQLYEFLEPEFADIDGVPNPAAAEGLRSAKRTPRGPGIVQVRAEKSRAEYVSPDAAGYEFVGERVKRTAEDMYRIMFQMALAEDNTGAMVKRSAESKNADHEVTGIVLRALGEKIIRPHAARTLDAASAARGEPGGWEAEGAAEFSETDVAGLVDRAVALETVPIPSATWRRLHYFELAQATLSKPAPEELAAIKRELDQSVTQDQFEAKREADLGDEEARQADAERRKRGEEPIGGSP